MAQKHHLRSSKYICVTSVWPMDTKHGDSGDSEAPNCAVNSQCNRCCCGQIQPGLSKHAEHPVTQWTQKEDIVFCFRRLSSLANLWHFIQLSAYRVSSPIFQSPMPSFRMVSIPVSPSGKSWSWLLSKCMWWNNKFGACSQEKQWCGPMMMLIDQQTKTALRVAKQSPNYASPQTTTTKQLTTT